MKIIFLLVFLSYGVYAHQSPEKRYLKTISELVDQHPEVKPLKEELNKAKERVFETRDKLKGAERDWNKAVNKNSQAIDNYSFFLDSLATQSSEGSNLNLKRDEAVSVLNAAQLVLGQAKEKLMEQSPSHQQAIEARDEWREADRKEDNAEREYSYALRELIESSIEGKYLQNEYFLAGYEYAAFKKLIEQPPEGLTEQSIEIKYLDSQVRVFRFRLYDKMSYLYPINLDELSPEVEQLLAKQFPEVWDFRERYKKAVREYHKALEKLIENSPEVQELRVEWNEAQEEEITADEERRRVNREYRSVLKGLIEKSTEVQGLKDKYEEAKKKYNKIVEEHDEFKNKLAENSSEAQALKEIWDMAQEEEITAEEAEDKADYEYQIAIYEYNKAEYAYHKALESLIERVRGLTP